MSPRSTALPPPRSHPGSNTAASHRRSDPPGRSPRTISGVNPRVGGLPRVHARGQPTKAGLTPDACVGTCWSRGAPRRRHPAARGIPSSVRVTHRVVAFGCCPRSRVVDRGRRVRRVGRRLPRLGERVCLRCVDRSETGESGWSIQVDSGAQHSPPPPDPHPCPTRAHPVHTLARRGAGRGTPQPAEHRQADRSTGSAPLRHRTRGRDHAQVHYPATGHLLSKRTPPHPQHHPKRANHPPHQSQEPVHP